MKKLLLLFCALLCLGGSGAWATDVVWESLHGWLPSSGGVGSFNWYGVHTPGTNDITYSMSSIQLKQSSGNGNTNYLAIATVSPGTSSTIVEANVLAVSSNSIKAETSTLYEYRFSTSVNLTGGTTYYLVFVTANTPTDGAYTIRNGRMEVNHLNCYSYPYGNNANVDWTPYFKATLTTTNSTKHYSYSCKNLAGFFLSSGYLLQNTDPTTGDAPSITGYTCQSVAVDATGVTFTYALTSNPLASATTAAGDIATKPKYTILESTLGGYVYYTEAGGDVKAVADKSKDGDDAHWIVVGDEANGYKLYNALTETSKVAVVADGNDKPIQMLAEASNTASLFDIRYISGAYRLYKKGTKWCTNRLSSSTLKVGIHTNVNNGSTVNVSRYNKTITYKLKWGDVEKASESVSVPTGDDPADYLPWDYPYCDLTCDVAAVTTETSIVNVTMTWDGPFDFSTDFASAKWYYMQIGGKYVVSNAETDCPAFAEKQVKETGLWAFVGNPYDGFYIINYASGEGKRLDINGTCSMKAPSAYNIIQIKKVGDVCLMYNDPANPFFLFVDIDNYIKGGNEYETYGSSLFTPVNWGELANAKIDEYYDSHAPGEYLGTSTELVISTKASITAMGASFTKTLYESLDMDGLIKYPSTGYYRIKSSGSREAGAGYITYGEVYPSYGNSLIVNPSGLNDPSSIIHFTKVSDGVYTLSLQGLNIQAASESNKVLANMDEAVNFTIAQAAPGFASIGSGEGRNYFHEAGWTGSGYTYNPVVGWDAPSGSTDASAWIIEDAENITVSLTPIGDYTYATLGLPFGVTLPADVKAYILTVSGEWAIPTEISEVPAGTGVLLRGTSSSVTSATLTINDAVSATTDGNKLVPTYVDITGARSDGEYILGNGEDGLGFYQRKSGRKIGANKAYLQLDADLAVKGLLLRFDEETGISTVQGSGLMVNGSEIFNLAGQRMSRVQKGVNIVNGKKVLVK